MFDDLSEAVKNLVSKSREINKGHAVVRMPRRFAQERRAEDEKHVKLHEERIRDAKAARNDAYDAREFARAEWENCQTVLAKCRRLGATHPDDIPDDIKFSLRSDCQTRPGDSHHLRGS